MRALLGAIGFLTIIPLKPKIETEEEFRKIVYFFPLVAVLLTAIYITISYFVYIISRSPLFASMIYVVLSIVLTGGLHYDGLADSCDGLLSGSDREKTLEIMSDSRIGTFGVLGIIVNIMMKIGIIYLLMASEIFILALVSVVFSRFMQIVVAGTSKPAKETGMGNIFIGKITAKQGIVVSMCVAIFTAILMKISFSRYNVLIIVTFLISFVIIMIMKSLISKKLGGITGDILGLTAEVSEVVYLYCGFIMSIILQVNYIY